MDDYIIHIGSSIVAVWLQDDVHQVLKICSCSTEPTGENLVLLEAVVKVGARGICQ